MEIEKANAHQPIPDHAKKVFEGVIFDVYQWEQEQFDGSTKMFEKTRKPDTSSVIAFTTEGKVIIVEQQQPGTEIFCGLPGGRIDAGETPLEAAKRELLEETGYEPESIELWHNSSTINKVDWTLYFFVAKGCRKVAEQHLDSGEKIKVEFIEPDEFLDMIFQQRMKSSEFIMRFLKDDLLVFDKEATYAKIKNYFL